MTSDAPPTTHRPWVELGRLLELDGHWTHATFADATGYSKPYVTLLLAGRRPPTRTVITKCASVLRVPSTMLEPPSPPTRIAYAVPEVAAMIGVDDQDVLTLVQSGEITAKLIGDRVLITDAALTSFFSTHATGDAA